MKKLLHDKTTGAFLRRSGEWTADKASACDFLYYRGYFEVVRAAKSKDPEWYYWFEIQPGENDFSSAVDWRTLKAA